MTTRSFDAIVVGAGPNGLTAANCLADRGLSVLVLEANDTIGGGARSAESTLPGFVHDLCSAIHPFGVASPNFRSLELERYGLVWQQPELAMAHPLPDGSAAVLDRALERTLESLGPDANAYQRLLNPFLSELDALFEETLRPMRFPRRPLLLARFGWTALKSCARVVSRFRGEAARALFAGCAAHSLRPLEEVATASFGLMLALSGHKVGWPCARGGSQAVADALARRLAQRGGEIRTSTVVNALRELPDSRVVLFDVTPRQLLGIAGDALPARYRRRLGRYRYGPGIFKLDWALSGPIPWRAEACRRAGTVHLGGSFEEIASGERQVILGRPPERPFVLVAQQSIFDPTRAPPGQHTGWAYCHVPHASTVDMTRTIEDQIERFAPGFHQVILARRGWNSSDIEARNANMIGGDIGGGANDVWQFLFRPLLRYDPYSTPNPRLFLCSSSTPPGGGVHGMCGYWAARSALRRLGA
jgi:phytoene dehydrogenase-like protein